MDKFGSVVAVMLALAGLGITISRFAPAVKSTDVALAGMFAAEAIAAAAIFVSKRSAMNFAFWVLVIRVFAGLLYMGVVHDDKLARSTLGFPAVEALYCWVRVRALTARP